jgi:hypothetical protein
MVDVYTAFAIILLAIIVFVSMTPPTREGLVASDESMRKMFVDTYNVVDNGMHGLEKMNMTGNLNANRIKLGDKWTLSGVGDKHGNDDWLRLFNKDGTGYYGGLAAGRLWSGGATHLNGPTSTRDINANGNVNVTGAVNASGNLCVQNECLNNTDIKNMKNNATNNNATSKGNLEADKLQIDSIVFQKPGTNDNTDPYSLRKIIHGGNRSSLRLSINNNSDETFEIWGDSCRQKGGCRGEGLVAHKFTADGKAWHKGGLTAGKTINVTGAGAKLCIDGVCLTKDDIAKFKAA